MSCKETEPTKLLENKTLTIASGGLVDALTPSELASIKYLTIKGTIDARDFLTIRDEMPLLATLDISETNVTFLQRDGYSTHFGKDTIPTEAFGGTRPNTILKSIKLPKSVIAILQNAFINCNALESIILPISLTTIKENAFNKCIALSSINIPASVNIIGINMFDGLNRPVKVYQDIFYNCKALKSITVDPGNTIYSSLDGVLFNKSKSELLSCPRGKNGDYYIPSTVTEIGDIGFTDCTALTSISIPASVASIHGTPFQNCNALNSIYAYSQEPPSGFRFPESNHNITLYVPANCVEAYKAKFYWADYKSILAL